MDPEKRASSAERAKFDGELSRFKIASVVTLVVNVVVGTSILFGAGGNLRAIGAAGLVAVGIMNLAELMWTILSRQPGNVVGDITGSRRILHKKRHRRAVAGKQDFKSAQIDKSAEYHERTEASSDLKMLAYAKIFYFGLLCGSIGMAAFVFGSESESPGASFVGSMIASIGLITAACALVSAEGVDEAA